MSNQTETTTFDLVEIWDRATLLAEYFMEFTKSRFCIDLTHTLKPGKPYDWIAIDLSERWAESDVFEKILRVANQLKIALGGKGFSLARNELESCKTSWSTFGSHFKDFIPSEYPGSRVTLTFGLVRLANAAIDLSGGSCRNDPFRFDATGQEIIRRGGRELFRGLKATWRFLPGMAQFARLDSRHRIGRSLYAIVANKPDSSEWDALWSQNVDSAEEFIRQNPRLLNQNPRIRIIESSFVWPDLVGFKTDNYRVVDKATFNAIAISEVHEQQSRAADLFMRNIALKKKKKQLPCNCCTRPHWARLPFGSATNSPNDPNANNEEKLK